MSDGWIAARLDVADVERHFRGMAGRAADLTPVWSALRSPMRADQRDHARAQSGPEGRWPRRAKATEDRARSHARGTRRRMRNAKRKAKFHDKPRRRFRATKLLGSMPNRTVKVQGLPASSGLVAWSMVPWSGAHQNGGRVGRGSLLPQRQFLWISNSFLEQAARIVEERIVGGVG